MEDLVLVAKLQRIITQRHDDVVTAMASGAVDNMEKYKYMLGQAHAYSIILQEISNLLNYKEQKNEQGNVIDIGDQKGNS